MKIHFFILSAVCIFHLEGVLKVGMELGYPPFETVCSNGDPCGISVDLVKAMGVYMNEEVQIENIAFVGLLLALQKEKIDLIVSSFTRTPEREKVVDFSNPYATIGLCLLANKQSQLTSIRDADQPLFTFVVKAGTSGEVYAARHLTQAKVRVLDKESACVLEVIQGKADAFIYDQLSVYRQWKKHEATTRAILEPFQEEKWAIAVRKGDRVLLDKINSFLVEFKDKGGFMELAQKYLESEKKAFEELNIPFLF